MLFLWYNRLMRPPVVHARPVPVSKRLLDLVLTLPALIVLSPVLLAIAAWIFLAGGGPVLYTQMRPGRGARLFKVYKFRTMRPAERLEDELATDAERLTSWGRFLRATSLDELPELFNVLKGEMSLVGPRPLLKRYLERYNPEQLRRQEVLPGITGWAQVNGRNALSWEDKFRLDVWYVDHWSLGLDLRILGRTVLQVIRREGINQPGQATAEEFKGNY